ncbi:MAG: hypothetical protein AAGH90_13240 [Pseudomonadota bacterium]
MSDPVFPSQDSDAPIDAEFEPAPKPRPEPKVKIKSGPGWFGFIVLGGVSLLALGLSVISSDLLKNNTGARDIAAEVDVLKVTAERADNDLSSLQADIATTTSALSSLREARQTDNDRLEDITGTLGILEADLQSLSGSNAPSDQVDGLDALTSRLDALEAILAERDPSVETAISDAFDASELNRKIAALRSDVESIRDELATLRGDLSGLIEAQEEAMSREAENTSVIDAAMALATIETAARRGQPFQTAFTQLEAAAPEQAELEALRPLASTSVPTLPELVEMFRTVKRDALKRDAESQGTTQSVLNTLFGDGIRVRREGETSSVDALETAEAALINGDLDAALSALETLPPNLQPVFTDWRQNASNRLTLERSLDRLRLTMIAKDRP